MKILIALSIAAVLTTPAVVHLDQREREQQLEAQVADLKHQLAIEDAALQRAATALHEALPVLKQCYSLMHQGDNHGGR